METFNYSNRKRRNCPYTENKIGSLGCEKCEGFKSYIGVQNVQCKYIEIQELKKEQKAKIEQEIYEEQEEWNRKYSGACGEPHLMLP